jgi:hypothetical protein
LDPKCTSQGFHHPWLCRLCVFTRCRRLSRRRRLTPRFIAGNDCTVPPFPVCPHLPAAVPGMDWRSLHAFRDAARGGGFYLECLRYGASLWEAGFAARSLLCLDRAMGADLSGNEPELIAHPMPYAAMAWIIAHAPDGVFLGNPRVHFQHYAGRMNEPRREQRVWRAWGCWALTRAVRPELPADARHRIAEPSVDDITGALRRVGLRGEAALFLTTLEDARAGLLSPENADLGA